MVPIVVVFCNLELIVQRMTNDDGIIIKGQLFTESIPILTVVSIRALAFSRAPFFFKGPVAKTRTALRTI